MKEIVRAKGPVKCVIGFDCSSKALHMVELDVATHKIIFTCRWFANKRDFDDRFHTILDSFAKYLGERGKNGSLSGMVAYIEEEIYSQNPMTTSRLTHVIAGVKRALHEHSVPYFTVQNHSWKKYTVGRGNASKEDIRKFALAKWGRNFRDQNYADAACVALYAASRFGSGIVNVESKDM